MDTINQYMQKIPTDVGNEILSFLIPEISKIEFHKVNKLRNYDAYNLKYEIAIYNNNKISNEKNMYLSRIYKKNGKHRYYITKEIIDSIEVDYSDRCIDVFKYEYSSRYVGKNINYALMKLLYIYK
jgi:hypothetical protein